MSVVTIVRIRRCPYPKKSGLCTDVRESERVEGDKVSAAVARHMQGASGYCPCGQSLVKQARIEPVKC